MVTSWPRGMTDYDHLKSIKIRYFPSFLDELIYGGYLTALIAPAIVLSTFLITNTRIDIPLLLISYLIPLIVYSYDYHRDLDKDSISNIGRTSHLQKKAGYYPIILFIYGSILFALLWQFANYSLITFIGLIIFGGLIYSTLLKNITKKIPLFKNIYSALNWSLAGVFFIPLYYSMDINLSFFVIFIFMTLRLMMNAFYFDLKDYQVDRDEGLKTLPVMLGKDNTIKIVHILNIIAFIPLIIGVYLKILPLYSLILLAFCFYSFYYLKMAKKASSSGSLGKLSYLADFEFILWPILLIAVITLFNITLAG
jgi:4-hydroxybenzoate polyprenyltransferase